jgi:hypothetical protein
MSQIDRLGQRNGRIEPWSLQETWASDGESEKRLHELLNLLPAAVYTMLTDASNFTMKPPLPCGAVVQC